MATKFYDQSGQEIPLENIDFGKYGIEQRRYKQDCRKRALDLAYSRLPHIVKEGDWIPTNEQIVKLADEHYNWLISIPE